MFRHTLQKSILAQRRAMLPLLAHSRAFAQVTYKTRSQPSQEEMDQATQLCQAAAQGNLKELQALKNKGYDLNASDYDFRTPLHLAAAVGNKEVVQWLIENGASQSVDRFGGMAIQDALRHEDTALMSYLQEQKIDSGIEFADPDMEAVFEEIVKKEGLFSFNLIAKEIDYYYNHLSFEPSYYKTFSKEEIAQHIHSLIAAKKISEIGKLGESVKLSLKETDHAFFLATSDRMGDIRSEIVEFIRSTPSDQHLTLAQVRSKGPVYAGGTRHLHLFHLQRAAYPESNSTTSSKLKEVCHPNFQYHMDLNNKHGQSYNINDYEDGIKSVLRRPKPHYQKTQFTDTDGMVKDRMIFTIKYGAAPGVNHTSNLFDIFDICERRSHDVRKGFLNTFSNGVVCYTVNLDHPLSEEDWAYIKHSVNMVVNIPEQTFIHPFLKNYVYNSRESFYLTAATRFAFYFMQNHNDDFEDLYSHLHHNPFDQRKLANLKVSLDHANVKIEALKACLERNVDAIKMLYADFESRMTGKGGDESYKQALKYVEDANDIQLLKTFERFNKACVKTNFYKDDVGAIGFRFDPKVFLADSKLPEVPFGIFMVVGHDFNGFHVRFRDISRGGIRMILSTKDNYEKNKTTQFQENYGLAYTQKLKNKDITESGSKGTVLIKEGKNHQGNYCFMQYMDTLLDLMLESEGVSSLYPDPEYLFFGPDENTANLMDPTAFYTQKKGYKQWKSITTGKGSGLGGIPHDTYGMTTRSVRQFVEGVQRKLGHVESECTKFVTGGPDGDLGSNEVLMGTERIVGIVDGSGVLYDPAGLDRAGLLRLVEKRQMIEHFDAELGDGGFMVKVAETNRTLPNGQVVDSGTKFRNEFHLNPMVTADYFVPCGGRPESINLDNVDKMFTEEGRLRFPQIIEGANLFITEPARQVLEEAGCTLYKDASTNKGGVTSSSLEVLAALSFEDEDHKTYMAADADGNFPEFYKSYVQEIIQRVETNAKNEFEFIWQQHKKTGKRTCELTLELSENMNDLFDVILASRLWENEKVRKNVLSDFFPKTLLAQVGYDDLVARIPESYLKATFAKYLASQYYYDKGTESNVYEFYEFVNRYDHE